MASCSLRQDMPAGSAARPFLSMAESKRHRGAVEPVTNSRHFAPNLYLVLQLRSIASVFQATDFRQNGRLINTTAVTTASIIQASLMAMVRAAFSSSG